MREADHMKLRHQFETIKQAYFGRYKPPPESIHIKDAKRLARSDKEKVKASERLQNEPLEAKDLEDIEQIDSLIFSKIYPNQKLNK